jgi:NADH:ubiquinone oxidoreductase subunit 6 (subunit J)
MGFEKFLFYLFALILLISAVRVITVRNPVHAALFLVLAFFTSAALWLLIEAEFLAIVLVLVYVGAVMVLFLFVIMMLDINVAPLREGFIRYLPVGIAVALMIVIEMGLVVGLQQYSGTGQRPVHLLRLSVRDLRGHSAGSDYRRDFADDAPPGRDEIPESGPPGAGLAGRPGATGAHGAGKEEVKRRAVL